MVPGARRPAGRRKRRRRPGRKPLGHRGRGVHGLWDGMDGGEGWFGFGIPGTRCRTIGSHRAWNPFWTAGPTAGCSWIASRVHVAGQRHRDAFLQRQGGNPRRAADLLKRLSELRGRADEVSSWEEFYRLLGLEELYFERSRRIDRVVDALADPIRSRGLRLGADLFSPSIAPLVGQDYGRFASRCDWIKPMTYFLACGPADSLEIGSFLKGLCGLGGWERDAAVRLVRRITGLKVEEELSDKLPGTAIVSGLRREVEKALRAGMSAGCRVCPGIEAVHHPLQARRGSVPPGGISGRDPGIDG
ncbi:MAG: hypothetical protein M0C28_23565 [Candidatus Moduliflexus flocculans]|nr:hypothetical protein [Candidatus Moduliflexus flocculans]